MSAAPLAGRAAGSADVAEVVTDLAAARALAPAWDELATACAAAFTARPSYALAWWEALGTGELHLVVVRRDGRLVALAPLHRRRLAGQGVLRWLGHGLGTVGEVLAVDAAASAAVWAALAQQRTPLQLTHVRPDAAPLLALRRDPAWAVRVEVDDRCPVLDVPPGAVAADLRSAATLKRLRRLLTASARAGSPVEVELVEDAAGLERRWADVVRVAALADAGRARTDLCAPPWSAFTLPFLRAEAAAGRLVLLGLLVDGRWSAHQVALRSGPVLSTWLTRFDPAPAVAAVHPGHQLLRWVADRAGDLGVTRVDQLIGQLQYKLEWATGGYDVATVLALPRAAGSLPVVSARLGAARGAGDAVRSLRTRVRARVTA